MKEFAFCIGKSSLEVMTTLIKNWNIWVPKIILKAKLETSNRNTLFQNFSAVIDQLSSMTHEELP